MKHMQKNNGTIPEDMDDIKTQTSDLMATSPLWSSKSSKIPKSLASQTSPNVRKKHSSYRPESESNSMSADSPCDSMSHHSMLTQHSSVSQVRDLIQREIIQEWLKIHHFHISAIAIKAERANHLPTTEPPPFFTVQSTSYSSNSYKHSNFESPHNSAHCGPITDSTTSPQTDSVHWNHWPTSVYCSCAGNAIRSFSCT